MSKQLSTLLRHGDLPREEDGAIEFWRLKDYHRNGFVHSQHWSDDKWTKSLTGGGNKKRFPYCTDPSGQEILYLRGLQGRSKRNLIDPSLKDNVFIPNDFFETIYHIGCALHHKFRIDTGKTKFERKTKGILYSRESHDSESPGSARAWFDQTTSCIVQAEVEKASGYGVGRYTACSTESIEVLSNKIERNHPLRCTPSLLFVVMKPEEIKNQKVCVWLRPPPKNSTKIIGCMIWILMSLEAAMIPTNKTKTQLSSTGRPVCGQESTKEIEKRTEFDHDTLGQDKHGVTDSTSTVRPVCGPESTKRCVLTPKHVEEDQTSTGRPVLVDQ